MVNQPKILSRHPDDMLRNYRGELWFASECVQFSYEVISLNPKEVFEVLKNQQITLLGYGRWLDEFYQYSSQLQLPTPGNNPIYSILFAH